MGEILEKLGVFVLLMFELWTLLSILSSQSKQQECLYSQIIGHMSEWWWQN
jgi:hypothetical protein